MRAKAESLSPFLRFREKRDAKRLCERRGVVIDELGRGDTIPAVANGLLSLQAHIGRASEQPNPPRPNRLGLMPARFGA